MASYNTSAGAIYVGFLILGLGVGVAVGQLATGLFVGVALAFGSMLFSKKSE
jgi:hypothetical protein